MNKTVLIVEDEQSLLTILVEKFTQEGIRTLTATNGNAGLASALANHPDVILLDIIMPVMDGMAMLDKLRKDSWGKTANVIILTNLTDTEKTVKSQKLGIFDFWIKCDMSISSIVNGVKQKLQ